MQKGELTSFTLSDEYRSFKKRTIIYAFKFDHT